MHFRRMDPDLCRGFDAEWVAQAGAEKKVRRRVKGTLKWILQYVQTRARNEFIDLQVLCDVALRALGPGVYENMPEWVEAAGVVAVDSEKPDEPARPNWLGRRRGGGWATGYK